jgi:hypothetical protein
LIPKGLEAKYSGQRSYAAFLPIMFSMSYETVVMIIFMAVEVVKKEVLVHPRKTPPKQSLDGAPPQENEFFGKLFSRSGKTALNAKQIGEQVKIEIVHCPT